MTSIWDTVVRVHWVAAVTLVPVASTALVEMLSVEEATSEYAYGVGTESVVVAVRLLAEDSDEGITTVVVAEVTEVRVIVESSSVDDATLKDSDEEATTVVVIGEALSVDDATPDSDETTADVVTGAAEVRVIVEASSAEEGTEAVVAAVRVLVRTVVSGKLAGKVEAESKVAVLVRLEVE